MSKHKFLQKLISLACVLMLLFGLCACSGGTLGNEYVVSDPLLSPKANADNFRVFYEIFVGGFSDSDGNGTGDFAGITSRLDYLNDGDPSSGKSLGIDGIWLMPIMPSPSYHKYDTTNYYAVDSKYGTMADFEAFLSECSRRGIKVIIDLVLNHTSDRHEWFKSAQKAVRDGDFSNKYASFYTISTTQTSWPYFASAPDGTKYYYEANFSDSMPELNFDNPAVRDEVANIAKFWLDKGVGGFRLDAVKYLYLDDTARNVETLKWFRAECEKIDPNCYIVGENWSGSSSIIDYYAAINCFDFGMSSSTGIVYTAAVGGMDMNDYASYLERYQAQAFASNPTAILNPFISNHDMDRAAGYLLPREGYMQMAANLYILSYGSPFIYYGEEIGMLGSRGNANTDADRRLAMLWGDRDTVKNPQSATFASSRQINGTVKSQFGEANSLYNYYKKLIMLRNSNPEIARGTIQKLTFSGYSVFGGFLSTYAGSTVGVFHNAGTEPVTINLAAYGLNLTQLRGFVGLGNATLSGTILTLGGLTSVVIK